MQSYGEDLFKDVPGTPMISWEEEGKWFFAVELSSHYIEYLTGVLKPYL